MKKPVKNYSACNKCRILCPDWELSNGICLYCKQEKNKEAKHDSKMEHETKEN